MLKKEVLKQEILDAVKNLLPEALREGIKATYPRQTKAGDKAAERFANTVTDIFAEPFSEAMASAIDYHVRSATIFGTIITVGGPVTQSTVINSPSAVINGKVPNTLGIM